MTYPEIVERQGGNLAALLIIEGMPAAPATSDWQFPSSLVTAETHATRHLPQQYDHFLDSDSVEWAYGIDFRSGDLKMPSCTFVLKDLPVQRLVWELVVGEVPIWTVTGRTFVENGITDLASGVARANVALQQASATAAATSVTVDGTTGWPTAGPLWWEQEACIYRALAAGPARFTTMTRGAFHSEARAHPFDQRDPDRDDDFGWEPRIRSYPISWKGRRVQLWLAEAVPGMASAATRVWNGRVSDFQLQPDGTTWQLQCESLWDAQRAKICTGLPKTKLRGMRLPESTLSWSARQSEVPGAWVQPRAGQFTMSAASYMTAQDLLTAFVDAINAALAADGVINQRYAGVITDQRMEIVQVDPQAAGDWIINVNWWNVEVLEAFFGGRTGTATLPTSPGPDFAWRFANPPPDSIVVINPNASAVLTVESTEDFTALDQSGFDYHIRMGCVIGETVFEIEDVDAGAYTLTVRPIFPLTEAVSIQPDASGSVAVQGCMILTGVWPFIWQGFLENASVPARWRIGLRSSDWDWDEMLAYSPGGIGVARARIIDKPVPLRDLMLEDIRFAGLVPALAQSAAKLSVRPLGPPVASLSMGALNEYSHDAKKLPRLTNGEALLISALKVKAKRLGWGNGTVQDFDLTIDNPRIAAEFEGAEPLELTCDGLYRSNGAISPAEISGHVARLADAAFEMFGTPAWIGECPCTIRPGLLLPGDSGNLTHATFVDPDTGTRGVTDSLVLVIDVKVRPFRAASQITVWLPGDPARRSGWAPCARVIAYTDNGGGAGAKRHELTVDTGHYHTDEAPFFLTGMLCVMMEWDVNGAPASDNLEITADGETGSIYVDSAPVNDPSVGTWVIYTRPYDTVSQTPEAQAYFHVCDEDDGLIGATTDEGFKPS